MEFSTRKSRTTGRSKVTGKYDKFVYPHPLQLYNLPPTDNISLQEFEAFAVERLKALQVVETVGIRCVKGSRDYATALERELKNLRTLGASIKSFIPRIRRDVDDLTEDDYEDRRKDHVSHFILRLAYCRTEELRRWFIAQELDLFRFRFTNESQDSISEFLQYNNLGYRPIAESEKKSVEQQLVDAAHVAVIDNTAYYKVPFTEALDLVKNRKVYLQNGYAYVPQNELVVIILSVFRSSLSHALAVASRALPALEEDGRLLPLLTGLSKRYLGQDYSNKKPSAGVITADMIDGLSSKLFPPCMQQVHQALRRDHHLKHWGRMQYGLFLKAIGVSLDEAMKFWRTEFTKAIDADKFEKSYAYNIRHNYGKEGKRADYTPYSCIKIITSNTPGPGDHHGCPFRHTDADLLQQRLQSKGFPRDTQEEIVSLCKSSHYQLACGRYFEFTHKVQWNFNPNHPNQYFEESQKALNGDKPPDDNSVTQSRGVKIVPSQSQKSFNSSSVIQEDDAFDDFNIPDDIMESMDTIS